MLRPRRRRVGGARAGSGHPRAHGAQDAVPEGDVPRGATAQRPQHPRCPHGERAGDDRPGLLGRSSGPAHLPVRWALHRARGRPDRPDPTGRRPPGHVPSGARSGPSPPAGAGSGAPAANRTRSASAERASVRGRRRPAPRRLGLDPFEHLVHPPFARERRPVDTDVGVPSATRTMARPNRAARSDRGAGSFGSRPGSVRRRRRGRSKGCRGPPLPPRSRPGS